MRWLFRPFLLILLALAFAIGAAGIALLPGTRTGRPSPLPVPAGAREIVWLNGATNASAWERFVTGTSTAVSRLKERRPELDIDIDESHAFPPETTAVPEVVLTANGQRLLFRWYKLTSDGKTAQWVEALTSRNPPPLAIIGGSSSDSAIDLANALDDQVTTHLGRPAPLLVLTQATAGEGYSVRQQRETPLTSIYAGRTFRFCFTNEQMALALTDLVHHEEQLRPDTDNVYVTCWEDDRYSLDLAAHLYQAMLRPVEARAAARDWGWLTGMIATGGFPLPLPPLAARQLPQPLWERIYCSVGTFNQPNRWESDGARNLVETVAQHPARRLPLVLPAGSSQSARRFLRGLVRTAPTLARRFVVITGDGISLNTIYRDRNVSWPVQDLPFDLVFFCHRNPVNPRAGFSPESDNPSPGTDRSPLAATGTEDLLLYVDIVEALSQAAFGGANPPADGDALAERLHQARWRLVGPDGQVEFGDEGDPLFDARGNRTSGTGEHVVWLHPVEEDERILPRAVITVWSWQGNHGAGRWVPSREPLRVDYDSGTDD